MTGVNDVWRQFDHPHRRPQVGATLYRDTYRGLIEEVRQIAELVLLAPFYLEPARTDPMRKSMDEYGSNVRELALEFDCRFGDTQLAFDTYLASNATQTLAADRVHPNRTGHTIIASCFLDAIGFTW